MASTKDGHSVPIEIDVGHEIFAITFTLDGKYLVTGSSYGVQVWRIQDGEHIATMEACHDVHCLAVSRNGRWIAAGTTYGDILVWDAETSYEEAFMHRERDYTITGVDFSPDSTRLVSVSDNRKASIWKFATRQRVRILDHKGLVVAARYSPQGDRIATATGGTQKSVLVWDSTDGRLLLDVAVHVTSYYNTGLVWSNNNIFVTSENKIKQINAFTGSTISEWSLPSDSNAPHIVLPQHGSFIVYSASDAITFWSTSTRTQLRLLPQYYDTNSIALSLDDQLLATTTGHGKISIKRLSHIFDSIPLSRLHPTFQEPDICISDTALRLWTHGQLTDAESLLTVSIPRFHDTAHHLFASRALVRARLQQWDAAIDDAEQSRQLQLSLIGYIASFVALVGSGKTHEGYQLCDIAFEHFHSSHVTILLLIKAIVIFMAGDHEDAIARVDNLIVTVFFNSTFYVIQAYMHLFLGNLCMENGNYMRAVESFELARAKLGDRTDQPPLLISLISGWKFEGLAMKIRRRLCESLYAAGRVIEAGERLLCMVDGEVNMTEPIESWVSDFTQQCLSTLGGSRDTKWETDSHDELLPSTMPFRLLSKWTRLKLARNSWQDVMDAATSFTAPKSIVYRVVCEHLEALTRVMDAVECLQEMACEVINTDSEQGTWILDFERRCAEKLVDCGDVAAHAQRYDDAITQYSTAILLDPITTQTILTKRSKVYAAKGLWEDALNDAKQVHMMDPSSAWGCERVLMEWAKTKMIDTSWRNALASAVNFVVPTHSIYQALCECLETTDHVTDAIECFDQMKGKQASETEDEQGDWIPAFRSRCFKKLDCLGDTAVDLQQYDVAVTHYSAALSLDLAAPQSSLIKRSKAYAMQSMWREALDDANKVIELDPSSPFGYERKYVALLGSGCDEGTLDAFQMMLSRIWESPDPDVHEHFPRFIKTREAIRRAIRDAIRESPRVLINTTSGRLCSKSEQAAAFELMPAFAELISSTTTEVDLARIEQEVDEYYRYATFSHKWEDDEPLFEKVTEIVVYELDKSLTHDKLRMFCEIVRKAGIHWAWSDTCCINKADHFVLQEALVAMFKWYQGSTLTIIFLRGVHSPPRRGDLVKSLWNTRAWTLQEYHASKVVRFYTEDWIPYTSLDIWNHKEAPEIISEMEEVTSIPTQALMALRPGLHDIREKLCLASRRETTFVEDAAYSLLGIFSITMPVVYGERDQALGRLLAQLLTNSGDTRILAWTGNSGNFSSCLPANIGVFSQLPASHIPPPTSIEMDMTTIRLRASSVNLASATVLYDRLSELPVPSFIGQRMKLPCLTFKLGRVSSSQNGSERIFRAQTNALGIVTINTKEDLSQFETLYLIHPWIDFLLDRQPVGSTAGTVHEDDTDQQSSLAVELAILPGPSSTTSEALQSRAARLVARLSRPFVGRPNISATDNASLRPPSSVSPMEKQMQVLQFVARLRQPFGALLFTPTRQHIEEYRRVAAESLITVRVEEITSVILDRLINAVRTLDVL